MPKAVTLEYLGVQATGRTKTEAKQEASATLERLATNCVPKVWCHRGQTVIVSHDHHGGNYHLVHPESEGAQHFTCSMSVGDVENVAISHLLTYTRDIGDFTIPSWCPRHIVGPLRRSWQESDAFQRAYAGAVELGISRSEQHHWACTHANKFAQELPACA